MLIYVKNYMYMIIGNMNINCIKDMLNDIVVGLILEKGLEIFSLVYM